MNRDMIFEVHERLTRNSIQLAELSGCHVLLKNESQFPWIIVVPQVASEMEDLHHLPADRFNQVMLLIKHVSQFVESTFGPEKLNVGCIGNQVRQMHIHVIGRSVEDPAWPNVVWGADFEKIPYSEEEMSRIQNLFQSFINQESIR